MTCQYCDKKAIYEQKCAEHFVSWMQNNVKETIEKYNLFSTTEKLLIAVSGGKDSQVLLHILSHLGYKPDALLIDEGISEYREYTVEDMKDLCASLQINLRVIPFVDEYGKKLDTMLAEKKQKPCTLCGTFRRFSLNKYAQGYDKIATGHNLDDEAQAILMNILSGQLNILPRLGPRTGTHTHEGFVPRVKPLYFLKEKEIRLYAFLKKLHISPKECPHSHESFRGNIRDWLNDFEASYPGTKQRIIDWFLDNYEVLHNELKEIKGIRTCVTCGSPSYGDVCKACLLRKEISSV